jgi:hypothetical protein
MQNNLYLAAKNGNIELIEKIKHQHYVNTGLYGACESGNLELTKYFIEKLGAWDITNAIYYACVVSKKPDEATIKYLMTFHGRLMIKDEVVNIYYYESVRKFLGIL